MTRKASNLLAAGKTQADTANVADDTIAFEDAALVERTRKGDMQAFGSLVAKYQDRVLDTIHRMCGSREDAEELAQEAFLRGLASISQFRGHSQFYTWLFRIAVNLVMSHRRRGGRVRFRSLAAPEDFGDGQAQALTAAMASRRDPSPQAAAMSAETHLRLEAALEELDEQMRIVVVLRDIEDMNYAQIAAVLDVPPGTVKSRLHRARCALKDKLTDLID